MIFFIREIIKRMMSKIINTKKDNAHAMKIIFISMGNIVVCQPGIIEILLGSVLILKHK